MSEYGDRDKRPEIVAGKPVKLKGSEREFFLFKDNEDYVGMRNNADL